MENKGYKKPIIMSILVIVFVLIISGLTYAVFSYTSNANDNTVKSGQVTMTYIEQSNSYVLDKALPKHDDEGMNDPNYFEFTVTSSAKTNATDSLGIQIPYEINISSKQVEEGKQPLPEENIKVYLTKVEDGQEVAVTPPIKISELGNSIYRENATKLAYKLNLHKNGNETISTTYRLRAWIDFDTDASTWDGTITYQYKFTVNINSDTKYVGYTTDPACFTFEDDGNGGKKITGFSSTCSATNIIVPNTYTSKTVIPGETKQILNSYTANEEEWIKILKTTYPEPGQTFEEYLAANNKTYEEFVAEAKENLNQLTSTFDSYIGKDINEPDEYDSTTVLDIYNALQDPTNEEHEMYSKVFTMDVETKTIPEHTEYKDYNITSIDTTDFQNKNIKTVILPDNIKLTNSDTFKNNKLDLLVDTNGHLPDACLVMNGTVLTSFKCRGIKNLDLSDKNITEIEPGDKLYPIEYPAFYDIETAVLPSTLEIIGQYAFARNKLATINLKNTKITEIKEGAFSYNQLTSVMLPANLEIIREYAFGGNQVSNIEFPNTLTTIGEYAFNNNKITTVKFSNTLTTIGGHAFYRNKIENLDLSNTKVTTIEGHTFYENEITTVKFPNALTTIADDAFYRNKIENLDLSNTKVTSIGSAFRNNKITTVKFPNTLTTIYADAFRDNKLTELNLSNTQVTTIGDTAFYSNNLKTITLPATVTELSSNVFNKTSNSNPNLTSIIYPGTTALPWDYALGGVNPTTKNLPPYTYNGVSITAN